MTLLRKVLGLDPGLSGAYALLNSDGSVEECGVLPLRRSTRGKKDLDVVELYERLEVFNGLIDGCALEHVHARPGEGVVGAFTFGRQQGKLLAVIELLQIPMIEPIPQAWKAKILVGTDHSKEASIGYVKARWPGVNLRPGKKRTDHDGIAEALVLAEFARLHFQGLKP